MIGTYGFFTNVSPNASMVPQRGYREQRVGPSVPQRIGTYSGFGGCGDCASCPALGACGGCNDAADAYGDYGADPAKKCEKWKRKYERRASRGGRTRWNRRRTEKARVKMERFCAAAGEQDPSVVFQEAYQQARASDPQAAQLDAALAQASQSAAGGGGGAGTGMILAIGGLALAGLLVVMMVSNKPPARAAV